MDRQVADILESLYSHFLAIGVLPTSPKRRILKARSRDFLRQMSLDVFKRRIREMFYKEWQKAVVDQKQHGINYIKKY